MAVTLGSKTALQGRELFSGTQEEVVQCDQRLG